MCDAIVSVLQYVPHHGLAVVGAVAVLFVVVVVVVEVGRVGSRGATLIQRCKVLLFSLFLGIVSLCRWIFRFLMW